MSDDAATQRSAATGPTPSVHRTPWLELFFDLVVVVAIASFAERLRSRPVWSELALVALMYLAVWLVWTSYMLYANVAADDTRRRAVMIAMGCVAVMASAAPGVGRVGDDRGGAFALAYIVARLIANGSWRRTGRVLIDWPIAQMSIGTIPWIASIFVRHQARYWLWLAGMSMDIAFAMFAVDGERILGLLQRGADDHRRTSKKLHARSNRAVPDSTLTVAAVDPDHYDERLGTFLIIVLGEAVSQVVRTGARRAGPTDCASRASPVSASSQACGG